MSSDIFYKKLIVVLIITFAATLVAAVLATYFAKRPKNDNNMKFLDYMCQNLIYIKEIEDYCKGSSNSVNNLKQSELPTYQLPSTLVPTSYDLSYNFYAKSSESDEPDYFTCDETIYFTCQYSTDTVIIHMVDLVVDNSSLTLTRLDTAVPNNRSLAATWSYDADKQFMFVRFADYVFVPNATYSLRVVFRAPFRSDATGLYKTFYTNQVKSARWIAVLQATPMSARKAFICFDEPKYKATFRISVVHSSRLNALSNMPLRALENANISLLRMRSEFRPTPVISTYELGLVVSDYTCSKMNASVGATNLTSVSACAAPDYVTKVEYSLGISKSLLEFFETFYAVKYSLPKCDFVGLPQQQSSGKSNWGLITLKNEIIFNDANTFSETSLKQDLIQISKQISKQWFGNLVTPKWWDDYWIFESFNSYISYIASNSINPEISILEQSILHQLNIMNQDAFNPILIDTQQVNQSLAHYFDEKSIQKGTFLMRMANYMLGVNTFSNGISAFLKNYAYSNARQSDFWDYFRNISSMNGANLSTIMYSWTRQSGHPVVNIIRLNSTHFSVSQSPFSIGPLNGGSQMWLIPFTYAIVDNVTTQNVADLFNTSVSNANTKIIPLMMNQVVLPSSKALTNQSYIVANLDMFGFYRVNYDSSNWDLIVQQLTSGKNNLPARTRAQLIDDLFAFSQANLVDPMRVFVVMKAYLPLEDDYLPWQVAIERIDYLCALIDSMPIYGMFRLYAIQMVTPIYTKLGWNETLNDSSLDKQLRSSILEFACALEMQDCLQKSISYFKNWLSNSTLNRIPIEMQRFIYCHGIENGLVEDWQYMYNAYTLEQDPTLKDNLLYGLSCARESWLIRTYLDYQLDPNFFVSNETSLNAFKYAADKSYSYLITWEHVKNNWNAIYSRFGRSASFNGFIQHLTRKFSTQDLFNDETNEFQLAQNRILLNLKWLDNIYQSLSKWLINQ